MSILEKYGLGDFVEVYPSAIHISGHVKIDEQYANTELLLSELERRIIEKFKEEQAMCDPEEERAVEPRTYLSEMFPFLDVYRFFKSEADAGDFIEQIEKKDDEGK